ncbi:unnamed protein product [Schistocephalus solidus]|uniref:FAS1 domain-containing protein n=1 Tax=Schistocephalus solidus TaxID=70667 RepID=A0A183T6H8_SCHSO|nr:unnamed protein product [Schistocephalus solidus]
MSRPNDIEFSVSTQQFSPCAGLAESTSQSNSVAPLEFLRNSIAATTTSTTIGTGIGQSALLTASILPPPPPPPPPPPADWLDWMKNLQASGKLSLPFAASASAAVALKPPEALLSMVQQRAYLNQSTYFPPSLPIMFPTMTMDMNSEADDEFPMNSLVKNSLLNMHLLAGQLPFWSLPPPSRPRPLPPPPPPPPLQLAAVSRTLRCADTMSTAAASAESIVDGSPTHEAVGFQLKSLPSKGLMGADEEKTVRLVNSGEATIRSAMSGRCKSTDLRIGSMEPERSQLLTTRELNSDQLQVGQAFVFANEFC